MHAINKTVEKTWLLSLDLFKFPRSNWRRLHGIAGTPIIKPRYRALTVQNATSLYFSATSLCLDATSLYFPVPSLCLDATHSSLLPRSLSLSSSRLLPPSNLVTYRSRCRCHRSWGTAPRPILSNWCTHQGLPPAHYCTLWFDRGSMFSLKTHKKKWPESCSYQAAEAQ